MNGHPKKTPLSPLLCSKKWTPQMDTDWTPQMDTLFPSVGDSEMDTPKGTVTNRNINPHKGKRSDLRRRGFDFNRDREKVL